MGEFCLLIASFQLAQVERNQFINTKFTKLITAIWSLSIKTLAQRVKGEEGSRELFVDFVDSEKRWSHTNRPELGTELAMRPLGLIC